MLDHYLAEEQEQRELEALNARDVEADKNCDLAANGRFDGLIGEKPDKKLITEQCYWQEYQSALQKYWLKQYGIEIEQEF